MSDPSVSDVDNDDIDQMIKGIDEFDDNLFSKSQQKSKATPKENIKDPDSKKKVKFEEDREFHEKDSKLPLRDNDKHDINTKPKQNIRKEINFDNDDDILGSLESKPKSNSAKSVMDDIFGTEKTKSNSFMDDIFGGKSSPKKPSTIESKDFILESKYTKPETDVTEPSSRRRRGNPTIGQSTISNDNIAILPEKKQTTVVPKDSPVESNRSENPFPWMSEKITSQTNNIGAGIVQNIIPSEKSPTVIENSSQLNHSINSLSNNHQSFQNQVDNKHLDIFKKEMDNQNELLERRRVDYTLALEKQKAEMSKQYEMLQSKQNQVKQYRSSFYFTDPYSLQMNQVQAEQGQKLLQQFQQKMEEEMLMRQNIMHNQFQMMNKLQSDFPAFSASTVFDLPNHKRNTDEEAEKELKVAMKEKITNIETLFKIKEGKIIENYEHVIKDLEKKLDIEQGRFQDAADHFKEEKERLMQTHKTTVERIHEDNRSMFDTMKLEYMTVIENLKSLRKLETASKDEINETTKKFSRLSLELEKQSQQNIEDRITVEAEQARNLNKREEDLAKKDTELQRLQEIILSRQESSDNERKKLTEAILTLESKLNKKEMEIESEKRQSLHVKEQLEYQTKQFEQDKEAFLTHLKIEKKKIYEERDRERKDIDRLKREHNHHIKQLKLEQAKYAIHKRLKSSQGHDFEKTIESDEIEQQLKVLEQERVTMKRFKQKLSTEEKRLAEGQRKLRKQRQDVSVSIEKLYEVERGINEKVLQLEKLKDQVLNINKEGVDACEEFNKLNYGVDDFLRVVEEALVNLLKQEQKIKNETLSLHGERKKINMTRSSVLCSACSRPVRKSFSSRDLSNIDCIEDQIHTKRSQHGNPPIAWMDLHGNQFGKVSSRILGSRTSCDGASLEALDTHVSGLKKDAENDKKYLKDEVEYLQTLQKINVKTLAKYQ